MDKLEDSLYEIYSKTVLPKLKTLEPERKKLINILIIKEILLFFNTLLFIFITYKLILMNIFDKWAYIPALGGTVYMLFTFFIMPGIALASIYGMFHVFNNAAKKFKLQIKTECMKDFTNAFSVKWNYEYPSKNLPFTSSNIFSAYTKADYDDTFSGEYKNTEFHVQEVKLILEGDKENKTAFKGIVICLPSNKTVKAKTIITTKFDVGIQNRGMTQFTSLLSGFGFIILGIGMWFLDIETENFWVKFKCICGSIMWILSGIGVFVYAWNQHKREKEYKRIILEDLNFDKRFNVQSKDQIEARYLVTTAFMERLQNLQTAFGTKNIKCSFFDDKVMFAISTNKDLFELGNLFVPLTDKKQINAFISELISIYNIIDYFKLAEKTGL